jgi:predicted RNA-binding protein with PIN domain
VAEPTLYLFDGSNLFHAGSFTERDELVDQLASFVAVRGVRGVVVFDGHGRERQFGALQVLYAPHADDVIERLAAEHRTRESVLVVTSDAAVRGTAGLVGKRGSAAFLSELKPVSHTEDSASRVRDRLDADTRARLEALRRGQEPT